MEAQMQDLLHISVSGRKFEIPTYLIMKYPSTLLGKIVYNTLQTDDIDGHHLCKGTNKQNEGHPENEKNEKTKTLVFNHPVTAFKAVLGYYQTGELHMPKSLCPKAFKTELDFWGLETRSLEKCCRFGYLAFEDEYETTAKFEKTMHETNKDKVDGLDSPSRFRRLRARSWSLLEYKEKSILAKAIRILLILCVALSITAITLETIDLSTEELNTCEMLPYLEDVDFNHKVIRIIEGADCMSVDEIIDEMKHKRERNSSIYQFGRLNFSKEDFDDIFTDLKEVSRLKYRHDLLYISDYFLLCFFTVELVLRLVSCPSVRRYILSPMNWIDIIVLVAGYAELILVEQSEENRYADKGVKFLYYLQVLRCLRLIRFVRNLRAIRVLTYTILINWKDLAVLLLYILIGVLMFANLIFFIEEKSNFPNIPESAWWAIITMTTVGYGDITPKSFGGKIIGSVCALSGVLVLALIIPVIANSFISLYQFSHLFEVDEAANGPIGKSQIKPLNVETEITLDEKKAAIK